jgi:hypothetical protein
MNNDECASQLCDSGTCHCSLCKTFLGEPPPLNPSAMCDPDIYAALFACICAGNCETACHGCESPSDLETPNCQECAVQPFDGCFIEISGCYQH